jgi:hypothetical protein
VTLIGGFTVPLSVLEFSLYLEAKGCSLLVDGDGLIVGPSRLLTDRDRQSIRRWRDDIRAVVAYCERMEERQ